MTTITNYTMLEYRNAMLAFGYDNFVNNLQSVTFRLFERLYGEHNFYKFVMDFDFQAIPNLPLNPDNYTPAQLDEIHDCLCEIRDDK